MSVAQREIVPLRENPELREWKQARKTTLKFPGVKLSQMAVTVFWHCRLRATESVNENLDWLLPLVNFH